MSFLPKVVYCVITVCPLAFAGFEPDPKVQLLLDGPLNSTSVFVHATPLNVIIGCEVNADEVGLFSPKITFVFVPNEHLYYRAYLQRRWSLLHNPR